MIGNKLLRIIFVQERVIIIISVVLIVNVEHYDRVIIGFLMFVHRYVISIVNHLLNDVFHLLFRFSLVLMNREFPGNETLEKKGEEQ